MKVGGADRPHWLCAVRAESPERIALSPTGLRSRCCPPAARRPTRFCRSSGSDRPRAPMPWGSVGHPRRFGGLPRRRARQKRQVLRV